MTEPERDLTDIPCCLERMHGAAMAKDVRRHPLGSDRRLCSGRGDDVFGEDIFEPRTGHRTTDAAEEQRWVITMGRAASHAHRATVVSFHSGRTRSRRPLPMMWMLAGGRASS